ncbi:MAG: hypothetical protein IJ833_06940 [Lachnospiraceae bacterium]|nr:hypothetical protein [Lachnospiraceae bacterium]
MDNGKENTQMSNRTSYRWNEFSDDTYTQFAAEMEEFGETGVLLLYNAYTNEAIRLRVFL